MLRSLTVFERLLRTLLGVGVVTLLGAGGWVGYQTLNRDRWALRDVETRLAERETEIQTLSADLKAKQREIQRLDTALRLLKVDHRVARIEVLGQAGSAENGDLTTTFSFVELDGKGNPLERPRVFTVKGDLVYVDAWVVKFKDQLVESGDPERSTSVYLFRRIFGEAQQPKEGFVLDEVGASPTVYRSSREMSDLEREIWSRFWEYANNPALAERLGVRAAHGEAPSIRLVAGKRYKVLLRASDGLTIVPESAPATKPGAPL